MGIVVFGAVLVDIKGYPFGKFVTRGRNAGRVQEVHGGVSRNVVEDIANVELRPTFVSMLDDSGTSQEIIDKLDRHKVNTKYIRRCEGGLGKWLAIFNNEGDVVASISQRPDLDQIADTLKQYGDEIISQADSVVVEIDMDSDLLKEIFALCEKYHKKIFAVVSNMSIAMDQPKYLDERLISQPVPALQLTSQEILRASTMVFGLLQTMREEPEGHVTKRMQRLQNQTEAVKKLCEHIDTYMKDLMSSGNLDAEQSTMATGLMFMTNEMERISALCGEIAVDMTKMRGKEKQFSLEAMEELHHLAKLLLQLYQDAIHVITEGTSESREILNSDKETIMKLDEKVRKAHMVRVSQGKCDASLTASYNALLHNVERIGNCCFDLAQMGTEGIQFNRLMIGDVVETGL